MHVCAQVRYGTSSTSSVRDALQFCQDQGKLLQEMVNTSLSFMLDLKQVGHHKT